MTTRREFLQRGTAVAAISLTACGGGNKGGREAHSTTVTASPPSNPPTPDAPTQRLPRPSPEMHLLKRASWGATSQELSRMQSIGMAAWLDEQLAPHSIDDSAVESELALRWTTLDRSGCELAQLKDDRRVMEELRAATLFRRVFSRRQLYELMVDFWTDHFTVYHGDGIARHMKTVDDREVIRAHALGRFRDMLHASARSPAMLEFLDNRRSTKDKPNENYARELLELHTLGVDGGYSETDIFEVARAFSGWTVRNQPDDQLCLQGNHREFWFNEAQHDSEDKIVLGQSLPAGRGIEDGNEVLNLLVDHPSTRRFIARKLYRRFVADDAPPAAFVELVAAAWGSDGDIIAMLRQVFASAEFAASADQKLRRPQEFAVASIRALEPEMDTDLTVLDLVRASGIPDLYTMVGLGNIEQLPAPDYSMLEPEELDPNPSYEGPNPNAMISRSGHVPFQWPAPDGYPDVESYWASVNGLLERWKYAIQIAGQARADGQSNSAWAAGDASDPQAVFDALSARLLMREVDSQTAAQMLRAAQLKPDGSGTANPEQFRRRLMALLLISPYSQRR